MGRVTEESVSAPVEREDEFVRVELARAEARRWRGRRRLVGVAVSAAVVGLVFLFVLPRIANYRDVWGVVRGMSWWWVAGLVGATSMNVATFAPPWMAALPGLGYLHSLRVTLASTALSMVAPGGAAVGMATSFAMLRRWGLEGRSVGLAVAVTGIWNQLFILSCPALAIVLLLANGGSNKALELAALVAVCVLVVLVTGFALGLQSARLVLAAGDRVASLVSWCKRLLGGRPVGWSGARLLAFRSELRLLLVGRWPGLTLGTLANQLSDFVLLVVALRATGTSRFEVDVVEVFAAWSLIRLLGSLPVTPSGIGVVELGLTGALVGFGATSAHAVAAVLVYRAVQIAPILLLGLLSAGTWRLGKPRLATTTSP
jgi:putative heme transporter